MRRRCTRLRKAFIRAIINSIINYSRWFIDVWYAIVPCSARGDQVDSETLRVVAVHVSLSVVPPSATVDARVRPCQ